MISTHEAWWRASARFVALTLATWISLGVGEIELEATGSAVAGTRSRSGSPWMSPG